MYRPNFIEILRSRWNEGYFLCVGLDPTYEKIPNNDGTLSPGSAIFRFNQSIIDQTKDIVCAYKPNSAFYEKHGPDGLWALKESITYANVVAPGVPVILDYKRGDIGNTNTGYEIAAFDYYGADAVTVAPYLGSEAMKPFLERKDKGIIVLCKTSNKGADEFQDLLIINKEDGAGNETTQRLYEVVAATVRDKWNYNNNCLLVAGATYPRELGVIRKIVGDIPLLIPGVGTQGGDVKKVLENGLDSNGEGVIINSSSGIIFAPDPREAALKLHNEITLVRKEVLEERKTTV